jgi:NADPH:quinone reductase-like Zn-dependent oxidoreductase
MLRIQYHEYGGPQVMRLDQFEPETPGLGEVLVDVQAAAVNPIDWKLRQGQLKFLTGRKLPRAMGSDFAGRIRGVGPDVTDFKVGDEVFGIARLKESGAFGETVLTLASYVTHRPTDLDIIQAACLATPGVMAVLGLIEIGKLSAGQNVFINGCTGGVGAAASQVAALSGAIVSGSCLPADKNRAAALGVGTVYDFTAPDYAQTLASLKDSFDIVFDTVGAFTSGTAMSLLRSGGTFLDNNASPKKFLHAALHRRHKIFNCTPTTARLDRVRAFATSGNLHANVTDVATLHHGIELITDFETGKRVGKGVITVG